MNDPILDQPDITRYDRGYTLLLNGSKTQGMPMISASAFAGQPHAISTLIWVNVLDGQIHEALTRFWFNGICRISWRSEGATNES